MRRGKRFIWKKFVAMVVILSFIMMPMNSVFAADGMENDKEGVSEEAEDVDYINGDDIGSVPEIPEEETVDSISDETNVEKGVVEDEIEAALIQEEPMEENVHPSVNYRAHVADIGWQNEVSNGEMAGTVGKALSMEGLEIEIDKFDEQLEGNVEYETHVQDIGWQQPVSNGELAGTVGKAKAIEAVRIRLTGQLAEQYDIYYRVHSATYGWFDWAKNGELAGSVGFAYGMQAIEIRLYTKDSQEKPIATNKACLTQNNVGDVMYQAHVKNVGWQSSVKDGEKAGTIGRALCVEGIRIRISDFIQGIDKEKGSVNYKAHVAGIGWQDEVSDGELAGTTGQNRAIEAMCINLSGQLAEQYNIYYRVHVSNFGWLGWTKNGEVAGSVGYGAPIEAIEIKLLKKDSLDVPDESGRSALTRESISSVDFQAYLSGAGWQETKRTDEIVGTTGQNRSIEAMTMSVNTLEEIGTYTGGITYKMHVSDIGWQDWVSDGDVAGTIDQGKKAEAIQIKLTGEMADYCDIYYRAHVSNFGWLGWAKNGESAGSSGYSYNLEAIQVNIVPKYTPAPGSTIGSFKKAPPRSVLEMMARANLYSSVTPYIILVNRSTHQVGVFQGWQGNWNNVFLWSCADGAPNTPTVEGVFRIKNRGYYFDSGAARCYWWTQFYGNYLFHSVLYNKNGVLMDGRVGMPLSHGCVRLEIGNAKWIYDNIPAGTTVVVYH